MSNITVMDFDIHLFLLECLKALYGLVDGPLLWQLALLYFLQWEAGFTISRHDENFLYIVDNHWIHAICTVHVDDLLVLASWDFLEWLAGILEKKFGKPKRKISVCASWHFL